MVTFKNGNGSYDDEESDEKHPTAVRIGTWVGYWVMAVIFITGIRIAWEVSAWILNWIPFLK